MKKNHRLFLIGITSIVSVALLSIALFFATAEKSYSDDTTKEGFVNNLMTRVNQGVAGQASRQSLIAAFCEYTAEAGGFSDPTAQGLYYDPKQSFFVAMLCTHNEQSELVQELITAYDREDANISGCQRNGDMTSCNFPQFIPKLFATVMNDLSKTKLAQLYSYQGTSTDEAVKAFSDTYFGPGDSICSSSNATYLGNTQGSEKEAPCLHPQTKSMLTQYIQQAGQMADQTIFVDAKKLLIPAGDTCEKNPKNFSRCAFDNTNTYAWDSFHNLLYNELLFYKMFMTLAIDKLQYPEYNKFRVYSDTSMEAAQEIAQMKQELWLSEQAVAYTEKTLQNMQASFPIHIGLVAYYEDIIAFRKSLLRIYTPIHQLYYKLRNVQQKQ